MSHRVSAVLFDLDGTLLRIDTEAFFSDYFSRLARFVAAYIPPDDFTPRLMRATTAMIDNLDPQRTNKEVFLDHFFRGLDAPQGKLMAVFDCFYREQFPELKRHSQPVDGARAAVESVLAAGCRAVVATAPVFPRFAIEERLRWAGLDDLPFALVTTYENMHFCKPHREYYSEIADKLGLTPAECLMVGNDVEEDLVAKDAGMLTFLAGPEIIHRGLRPCAPDFRGLVRDVPLVLASS